MKIKAKAEIAYLTLYLVRKARRSYELLEQEIADRQNAIATTDFPAEYEKCVDQIDAVRRALEDCQAHIDMTDSTIKS